MSCTMELPRMERSGMMDARETAKKLGTTVPTVSNRRSGIYLDLFYKPPTASIKRRVVQASR